LKDFSFWSDHAQKKYEVGTEAPFVNSLTSIRSQPSYKFVKSQIDKSFQITVNENDAKPILLDVEAEKDCTNDFHRIIQKHSANISEDPVRNQNLSEAYKLERPNLKHVREELYSLIDDSGEVTIKQDTDNKAFLDTHDIQKGIKIEAGEVVKTCDDSRDHIKSELELKTSVKSKKKIIFCKGCIYQTPYRSAMRKHQLKNACRFKNKKEDIFYCKLCEQEYTNKFNLKRHNRSVHEKLRPYSCDKCDKSFNRKETLAKHSLRDCTDLLHSSICSYCGREYIGKGKLKAHIRRTHRKKLETCNYCFETIAKDAMKRHMKRKHSHLQTKVYQSLQTIEEIFDKK